ncbi:MAG: hypothetical protein ACLPN1_04935 [Dissulfurispiraceae bacterium]
MLTVNAESTVKQIIHVVAEERLLEIIVMEVSGGICICGICGFSAFDTPAQQDPDVVDEQ